MNRRQFLACIAAVVERMGDGCHALARRIHAQPIEKPPLYKPIIFTAEVLATMSLDEFEARLDEMTRQTMQTEANRVTQAVVAATFKDLSNPVA